MFTRTSVVPVGEIDDRFDVVAGADQRVGPFVERHAPGDEAFQPSVIGATQGRRCGLVVAPVGVHRTEDDVVTEDNLAIHGAGIDR